MTKKKFIGYQGKFSAKVKSILITGASLLVIGGSIWGATELHEHFSNQKTLDANSTPEYTTPSAPSDDNKNPLDGTTNLTPPSHNKDTQVNMSAKFTDVLAKLTAKSKEYIKTQSGQEPNLTISGFTAMNINPTNGEVVMLGQFTMGGKFNNFIATMQNLDTSLNVYNLSGETVGEDDLINALDQLLSDQNTTFNLQLKQHISLANESHVINNVLTQRMAELQSIGGDKAMTELQYLKNLDKNNLQVSLVLNSSKKTEDKYIHSFTTIINTGKYIYSIDHEITSEKRLTSSALKLAIEEYLSNDNLDFDINISLSSSVNKSLYLINEKVNTIEDTQTLSK